MFRPPEQGVPPELKDVLQKKPVFASKKQMCNRKCWKEVLKVLKMFLQAIVASVFILPVNDPVT